MAIWFTSDTHFNHQKIIQYSQRPFVDLDDMTQTIIERWNSVVKPGDIVYHLGDFALSWGKQQAELIDRLLASLNGQKWLIAGNHDRDEVTNNARWVKVKDYHVIKVDLGGQHRQKILMCHYPMRVWDQMNRGSWMLHGHCHGSLIDIGGRTMDVGVDAHSFQPIELNEVAAFMSEREMVECDHHTSTQERLPPVHQRQD